VIYREVDDLKMRKIFKGHLLNGEVQSDFALARGRRSLKKKVCQPGGGNGIPMSRSFHFLPLQNRGFFEIKVLIDPEKNEEYVWRDGYQAGG